MQAEDKQMKEVLEQQKLVERKKPNNYAMDIVVWSLWLVLMWGFLAVISLVDSPRNSPGIHEVIITAYFMGFSIIFGIIYLMVLKRG